MHSFTHALTHTLSRLPAVIISPPLLSPPLPLLQTYPLSACLLPPQPARNRRLALATNGIFDYHHAIQRAQGKAHWSHTTFPSHPPKLVSQSLFLRAPSIIFFLPSLYLSDPTNITRPAQFYLSCPYSHFCETPILATKLFFPAALSPSPSIPLFLLARFSHSPVLCLQGTQRVWNTLFVAIFPLLCPGCRLFVGDPKSATQAGLALLAYPARCAHAWPLVRWGTAYTLPTSSKATASSTL